MTAADRLRALLATVPHALEAQDPLQIEGSRLFTPPIMGRRRPRKPWRIGVDGPDLAAVLQVDGIDAAWMPLVGSSGLDALEMITDSINAHAGIELDARVLVRDLPAACVEAVFSADEAIAAWSAPA